MHHFLTTPELALYLCHAIGNKLSKSHIQVFKYKYEKKKQNVIEKVFLIIRLDCHVPSLNIMTLGKGIRIFPKQQDKVEMAKVSNIQCTKLFY